MPAEPVRQAGPTIRCGRTAEFSTSSSGAASSGLAMPRLATKVVIDVVQIDPAPCSLAGCARGRLRSRLGQLRPHAYV